MEVKLHMSTAYLPQIDGQIERVNQCLEIYLRCICFHSPHRWLKWLSLVEWWYNTNYHSSLEVTPYQALYGHPPLMYPIVNMDMQQQGTVVHWNKERTKMIQILRDRLKEAQNRMKQNSDKKRIDRISSRRNGIS